MNALVCRLLWGNGLAKLVAPINDSCQATILIVEPEYLSFQAAILQQQNRHQTGLYCTKPALAAINNAKFDWRLAPMMRF
ncbi:MAG: hypothetical protein NTV43_17980 [Methylococcales bacterium]|nr:hypothetical protein [Methylococcales bacterium]